MTDTRHEHGWRHWLTSWWARAGGLITALALFVAFIKDILAIMGSPLFAPSPRPEITVRDLKLSQTYPANLYELSERQDLERLRTRKLQPAKGYVAQLHFIADKTGNAPVGDCAVETEDGAPMWNWLGPAPPQNKPVPGGELGDLERYTWDSGGELGYLQSWLGNYPLYVGSFDSVQKRIEFEVFLREPKRTITVTLVCAGRRENYISKYIDAPKKNGEPYVRIISKRDPSELNFYPVDPRFGPVRN